ncbi:ABC transporter substrate-binding protein [Rhodoplanes sp. TEM]|uniref:ABC transporter substrate-binding protein n=1 Tax=Rhodoplanes tepidamans TaxID=200616 RepID=A0ABT5JCP9_RHOTP|nr:MULTISPECIES: ABC transporter substrate-binding protein [Rhodoplanes]MDC7787453.1 ABC transporter substrate-binding protein [Rhodoplanes tepidamans]MDC7986362.1 ABC transporter substrate-binding protein [Rhodoplanes sp. TEM]MDQ0358061.1 NitT/TauT family transport system substrate-binding protein [Rhodoplanes tepidamans]
MTIPSRRRFVTGAGTALAVAGLGLAGLVAGGGLAPAAAADQVSVQLDYVVRGNHAMFFVGRKKGLFAKHGIEVTAIRRGTGSANTMRMIGNGNAEFGFGDLPTLAIARSQNVPVVALAAVNQKSPMAMISIAAKHKLTRPQDLKGLNFAVQPSGSTYIFTRAFFAANGMSEEDVKRATVSPPYENYLLLGRVDAVPGYVDAEVPELEAKAGGPGSLSILLGSDWGYKAYGSGLLTSEKMIAEKPDLVQRFVTAYLEAFRSVIENPAEAVDIVVEANPEYAPKRDVLLKQIEADLASSFFSDDTRANGIGAMRTETWEETAKTLLTQGAMKQPIDVSAAFAGQFVKAANPLRR